MGRSIFRIFLILSFGCGESNAVGMVQDVAAIAWLKDIAGKSTEVISNGLKVLDTAKQTTGTLLEINNVMGGRLSVDKITKLNRIGLVSDEFGGLLHSLNGEGDPLRELNYVAQNFAGAKDMSNAIYAKEYFESNFFPKGDDKGIPTQRADEVRQRRDDAADDAALNTLAIAKQQRATMEEEHKELIEIANEAKSNDTLHYQANVQTKLLTRIAVSLEKLVLLQSQQLDFMAKMYLKEQPVGYTKIGGSTNEKKKKN